MNNEKKTFGKRVEKFLKFIFLEIMKQIVIVIVWLVILVGALSYLFTNITKNLENQNLQKFANVDYGQNVEKVLLLSFPNGITDEQKDDFNFMDFAKNNKSLSLSKVIEAINFATDDISIKKIYINLDTANLSQVQIEEIFKSLYEFKEKGKKIVAYGHHLVLRNYHFGSIADHICMNPSYSAFVNLTGYSMVIPYYKELTDNIGITYNVIHIGDYKIYGENYVKENMSDEFKMEIEKIYSALQLSTISDISFHRGKDDIDTYKIIFADELLKGNLAYTNTQDLLNLKIIDSINSKKGFEKSEFDNMKIVDINTYLNQDYVINNKKNKSKPDKIAVIYAEGNIYMDSNDEYKNSKNITPNSMEKKIEKAVNDKNVKAIVIRVNSPGGSALASDIIYNNIKEIEKPVYVSMGNMAASGGYYISLAGKKIFANQNTITGSIGVVTLFPNIDKLGKKIGVNFEVIKNGENSDILNLTKRTTEKEIEIIRKNMNNIYEEFKGYVSLNRGLDDEDVEEIAQGKVWTGVMAMKNGLIDEIGGLEDAIKAIAEDYDIKNYEVVTLDLKQNLFNYISTLKNGYINVDEILYNDNFINEKLEDYINYKTYNRAPVLLFPHSYIFNDN